ncbi:E3 ubiquitin-protein ligase XIAP isoform X1 [Thalassophryne amazonica]|uniref:E3 ubiquitin-protein ligase XIAP isoform X1 n=1 Tax=Thalassophryne amazonica TaxID=390379 RepID=UPI001471BF4F|nr:E3 ubiquitin-protein ligase XIAP isoform X1 [Thalassophryne amazonica]XP_034037361.1 E3 ubiquitin-protein ligase XIAP isoform X1 [Thalassophryne amazonica]
MSDTRYNCDLESDSSVDFSQMNYRLDSFRGSTLAQQVPAKRLAQAGFYFTGHADRVRCFSCHKTVENWCKGDTPVERHKQVSPSCKFLNCVHVSFNPNSDAMLINGSNYNEEAEDMDFLLRTGEVVDQSIYPIAAHMRSEESRLQTFSSWPSTAPVSPRDLAQAGLFYSGESDRVQCFCCGGILAGWEIGDSAWGEHSKHFPRCFFVLGHDVGNIPYLIDRDEESSSRRHTNSRGPMERFEDRLRSFRGVQHPVDHERLARAGFYSAGTGDKVLCFCCGGGLKGWQPVEDPWEEHAKHYPGCSFLLAEKGQEFVNRIQLKVPQRNMTTSSNHNGLLGKQNDKDPTEQLRKLQMEKQCKVCMDRDSCMVFIPCGHLATCSECSELLMKCPICCAIIKQKIKTYIS